VQVKTICNPSFITRERLRELTSRWPQVTVG
jgi:hypothetical protein